MDVSLSLNDVALVYQHNEVGDLIIKVAQGIVDEIELSAWLRYQAQR
jgi:hypothetical protein